MSDESKPVRAPLSAENMQERILEIANRDSATAEQPARETTTAAAVDSPPIAAATSTPIDPDNWWDNGLVTEHNFLKGRKGDEVEKIVRSADTKIRTQGEENARLRRELDEARMERVAERVVERRDPRAVAPAEPQGDPREEEYAVVQFTDSKRAAQILREWAQEDTRNILAQRDAEVSDKSRAETIRNAGRSAIKKMAAEDNVSEQIAEDRMLGATVHLQLYADKVLQDNGGVDNPQAVQAWQAVWANEDNYREVYRRLYPASQIASAPISAPIVAPLSAPPGVKSVAATQTSVARTPSPLTRESELALSSIAEAAKLTDPKKFIGRVAARG